MRTIDSPHEITPRNMILREKFQNFSIFASIHIFVSLNQGQGSVFTLRDCAQSISRLEKPKNRRFAHKNPKMFDFRFNTPSTFSESGSRTVLSRVHTSEIVVGIEFEFISFIDLLFTTKENFG